MADSSIHLKKVPAADIGVPATDRLAIFANDDDGEPSTRTTQG